MENMETASVSELESSQVIEEGLVCKLCESEKDFNVLSIFIKNANQEGYPFKDVDKSIQKAFLLINSSTQNYLGFLVWKKDPLDRNHIKLEGLDFESYRLKCCGEILQLIFIVQEERRKGLASKFIKYWVENVADETYKLFGVEIMGGSFILNVLIKLGYIDQINPKNSHCYLIETGRKAVPKYYK
jgi:hypothetical protein